MKAKYCLSLCSSLHPNVVRRGCTAAFVALGLSFLCSCTVEFDLADEDGEDSTDFDLCPDDPDKELPGACGCGVEEGACEGLPELGVSEVEYVVDEEIVVTFSFLPGNKKDWIGLFNAGANDKDYLDYLYTDGEKTGTMKFKGRAAGTYEARLFFNDSYDRQDAVTFLVVEPE